VQAFFEDDADQHEIPIVNLLCRVKLVSPKLSKFGCRIRENDWICAPSQEDYERFCDGHVNISASTTRKVLGVVSSARCCVSNEIAGLGHISVHGLVDLLGAARHYKRKFVQRCIFVLIRRPFGPGSLWGAAFLSVACD
jgi:hypothetical protein